MTKHATLSHGNKGETTSESRVN